MNKVIRVKSIFLLLCVSTLNSTSFADELVKRTQVMMGTYVSVSLDSKDIALSSKVFSRLKEVELALSSYDENAQIFKLNHERKTRLSQNTYEALALSTKFYKETKGYFDVTIGSVTKSLFHFGEIERIPSAKELLEAKVYFQGLHFNTHEAWIDKGVKVDLGGMGKGFGVDKAVALLKNHNINRGVVALSGDIFCLHACKMAIQDPFSESPFASFSMAQVNTSISTSGNYRRYVKSKKYNHLINPKTKKSQKSFASLTLISTKQNNATLDAYATAASVMPKDQAFAFLNALNDIGYLVIEENKKVSKNKVFDALVKGFTFVNPQGLHEREYIRAVPLRFQSSKKQ